MRIAHISDCYLPRTGGIETQVRALAMQQLAQGDEVRIITATPGGTTRSGVEVIDRIPVERITARIPGDLPIHPRTRAHVLEALKRNPVDVVHVHVGVISPFAWGAVRAAHRLRLPVLVTVHGIWGPLAGPGYRLSDVLTHWSKWGVQLSAVSEVAARRIEHALPGVGRVLVLPNGIDPMLWLLPQRQHDSATLNIVTVMRLAPRKRTLPLLKIMQAARNRVGPRVHLQLRIVGDGPERTRAEAFVGQHGLSDAVTFTGRLDHGGIREVFAMSDVYVQASVRESFGIAALEARSAGLPVVARAQTGTAQFIRHQHEGLLADNDAEMAIALARLATDRPLLEQLSAHNREYPPEQAWPRVLELVGEAYAQARALD
ncbi:MAG: glycosyltransferase family 4 protein [Candidatus Nanopelagicales bacterium]